MPPSWGRGWPVLPPEKLEPSPGFVLVGRVLGPHGVQGGLRVQVLSDYPRRFAPGSTVYVRGVPRRILACSRRGDTAIVHVEDVQSRTEAEGLRGVALEVQEAEVPAPPEGTYYHFQVLGMEVFTVAGRRLGVVAEILSTPANDVYVVRGDGRDILVPAVDRVVVEMDVARRRMVVELLQAL